MMPKKIVITGAPGTGKSTVINHLDALGYQCMHEVSRAVTLEAQQQGTKQLFLEQPLLFSKKLLEGRIQQFLDTNNFESQYIFFDRGIPDIQAYLNYNGGAYPNTFSKASAQYQYDIVFIMPPWSEIYEPDNERYETYKESLVIHKYLEQQYLDLGYRLYEVPRSSVEDRTTYILGVLKNLL